MVEISKALNENLNKFLKETNIKKENINLLEDLFGGIYLSINLKDAKKIYMKHLISILDDNVIVEFDQMELSKGENTILIYTDMYLAHILNKDFENMTYLELCEWF